MLDNAMSGTFSPCTPFANKTHISTLRPSVSSAVNSAHYAAKSPGRRKRLFFLLSLLFLVYSPVRSTAISPINVYSDKAQQVQFAAKEIEDALASRDQIAVRFNITDISQARATCIFLANLNDKAVLNQLQKSGAAEPGKIQHEGFSIRVSSSDGFSTYWILGADAAPR